MNERLAEREQVVSKLMTIAVVTQPDENQPDLFRVVVPGAIREENIVSAKDEAEAIEKVRAVLMVKEQSRLESQAKVEAKAAAGAAVEDTGVEVSPDNMNLKFKAAVKTVGAE